MSTELNPHLTGANIILDNPWNVFSGEHTAPWALVICIFHDGDRCLSAPQRHPVLFDRLGGRVGIVGVLGNAGPADPRALSAPQQLDGVDIPTFEELGYAVDLVNWRGFVAAADISDADFEALRDIVRETTRSEAWADALARNRWEDSYLEGPELLEFLEQDQAATVALVKELGL